MRLSVWNLLIQHIIIFVRRGWNSQHFYSTERANNHKFIPAIWQLKVSRMSLFYCRRLYSLLGIIKRQYRFTSTSDTLFGLSRAIKLFAACHATSWERRLITKRFETLSGWQNSPGKCQESARPWKIYVVFDFFISFLGQFPSWTKADGAGMHVRGLWILLARYFGLIVFMFRLINCTIPQRWFLLIWNLTNSITFWSAQRNSCWIWFPPESTI
jgi:hypothetical protein